MCLTYFFFFQAEDGIRDIGVTGVQTCALPIFMMLDVDFAELRQGVLQYLPIGALIGVIFLIELVSVVGAWTLDPAIVRTASAAAIPSPDQVTNTVALGRVLYTQYFAYFQLAGLILLVAMIG